MSTPVPSTSHQTVRLARGKHSSPDHGACVMELVSMLAGESFTDRPRSACPVIAAFLRSYNDAVDDRRRQDLYAVAAEVVGTRGPVAVERARAARCAETLRDLQDNGSRLRRALIRRHPVPATPLGLERAGIRLARELHRAGARGHTRALALVRDLVAMGRADAPMLGPASASAEPVELART
jgi:hypothetical protein